MLEAREVGIALDGVPVVDGVGFALEEGEWLGLIGPNGAGKTTILKAVAGLVRYSGSIRIQGDDVARARSPSGGAARCARSADSGDPSRYERARVRRPRPDAPSRLRG